MLPLFPALALRVKRRYGPLVLKQQRMLPDEAVTPADRQAVMAKIAAKRHRLESALTVGATELQRFRLHAPARTMPLMEPLRQAAEKLAQAQADLSRC